MASEPPSEPDFEEEHEREEKIEREIEQARVNEEREEEEEKIEREIEQARVNEEREEEEEDEREKTEKLEEEFKRKMEQQRELSLEIEKNLELLKEEQTPIPKLIPSADIDYNQVRLISINSLQYVWDILKPKILIELKLIKHTMGKEKFLRIKAISSIVLYQNLVKIITDTRNENFTDVEELKAYEEALYSRFIPQIKIIQNKLTGAFLEDANYHPKVNDFSNLKLFNCLNLDLRELKNQFVNKTISQIDTSKLGSDHHQGWYEGKFRYLNQVYWTIPGAFNPLRNEGEHGDENIDITNFDFLTNAHAPANTIVMTHIAVFMIYFCMEILTTWIQTCKYLGILNKEKIDQILKEDKD